ncbi:sensor histidine kinase [Parvularcula dongshanensis]|uniref:histidine kinase n=1 Tax=Parvularcula dongshanensis TaxID=1173995 RepID=A0A840I5E3_9PROT|nr:sensor histidine kinase [Parvularcula dongshanensis]MBB4659501.1 two-component sensor histidine kinase [Parvularcula dongshanensis]
MSVTSSAAKASGQCDASLEEVLESATEALVVLDETSCVVFANAQARAWLPQGDKLAGGKLTEAWASEPSDLAQAILRLLTDEGGEADGSFEVEANLLRAHVVRSGDGWTISFVDVADTRPPRDAEARDLLLREMNHRMKNLFSMVSGMISMSARGSATPTEMAERLRGRVASLARAHELISPAVTGGEVVPSKASLRAIVEACLAPHAMAADPKDRIEVSGPKVIAGADATTSLTLVFHELATNAVKYGALSVPAGKVKVRWRQEGERLFLSWIEADGPALAGPPEKTGFGLMLVRTAVCTQLGGQFAPSWDEKGLRIDVSLPTERLGS